MHLFHFFIPHRKNNHRAKILHNLSLLILVISVALFSTTAIYLQKTHPEVLGISYQISDIELLNLTNYQRQQNGLPPLALSSQLSKAASKKSQHMFLNNYWAHFAPDGTSPWDLIRDEGYNYTHAGENLAKGFTTSYDTVEAWMKSPTHKANILSPNFKEVGFSVVEGSLQGEDTVLIVQEFGAREFVTGEETSQPLAQNPQTQDVQGSKELYQPVQNPASVTAKPAFDVTVVAKTLTFLLLSALLIALVLDFVIIEKKKIPRSVGNNLDHIILVTIFLTFILMSKLGQVI